jgi:CheY-like chemotaxis protein
MMGGGRLDGLRILVVEDDFTIAFLIATMLEADGAAIVGPARSVKDALALVEGDARIDRAVLDVNLGVETVYPVAEALRPKGVRMVFLTGYDRGSLSSAFADMPCLQKPVSPERLIQALVD